ncbi:MAG: glycosyltransferase [Leptospiraceae bacterium]|nr:glycosyltransferase [Leptospiraceae bacterium]
MKIIFRKIIFLCFQYSYRLRNFFKLKTFLKQDITINPLISILVPVYNTNINHLKQMIESVRKQSYQNWELILWNDASSDDNLNNYLNYDIEKDDRILLRSSEENQGIAKTTKLAFNASKGVYITFLDHDDELLNYSLSSVVNFIEQNNYPEFIYTDEIYNSERLGIFSYSIKNKFSIFKLLANNYICHQVIVSRNLLQKMGGYREGFDGSQDHEFALRASRFTDSIHFIPEHLYKWRLHRSSFSHKKQQICIDSSLKAIHEHFKAKKENIINIEKGNFPFTYHVQRQIKEKNKVLIIIPLPEKYKHSVDINLFIKEILKSISHSISIQFLIPKIFSLTINRDLRYLKEKKDYFYYASNSELEEILVYNKADYFFFLHPNLYPQNINFLYELIQLNIESKVAAVTPIVLNSKDKLIYSGLIFGKNGFIDTSCNKLTKHRSKIWCNEWIEKEISGISKHCFFVKSKVWKKLNKKSKIHLNNELWDVDLSLRILKSNYILISNPFSILTTNTAEIFKYLRISSKNIVFVKNLYAQWSEDIYDDKNYSKNANLLGMDMYPRGIFHDFLYKLKKHQVLIKIRHYS